MSDVYSEIVLSRGVFLIQEVMEMNCVCVCVCDQLSC